MSELASPWAGPVLPSAMELRLACQSAAAASWLGPASLLRQQSASGWQLAEPGLQLGLAVRSVFVSRLRSW